MATTIGTIELLATIDTSKYKKGGKDIESTNKSVESSTQKTTDSSSKSWAVMGAAIGAIAGITQAVFTKVLNIVTSSISSAVKRVDTLNNANRTFENMGFSAGATASAMEALKDSILGLPTPLDQAVEGVQLLAGATNDVGRAQKIFTALNNAIIGFGGSAYDVQGAIVQLSQAFSNGRVDAQTWNSLIQSGLGPALNALARQMGKTTGELKAQLSDGTISVEAFQDALIKMNKEGGGGLKSFEQISKDATSGIGTGWANLQTAITRGLAKIIEAIGAENISNFITTIGKVFETSLGYVVKFIDLIRQVDDAFNTAKRYATDFYNEVVRVFNSVTSYVSKLVDSGINVLNSGIQEVVKALEAVKSTGEDVFKAVTDWVYDWRYWIQNVSIVIGTVLLPKITAIGIEAIKAGARTTASFVSMAVSATINAAQASFAWTVAAAKTSFAWVTQTLPKIILGFASTAFWAGVNAAKVTALWVASSARTLLSWGITFTAYAVNTALMVAQTGIAAAKVAASWLLALGPLGLIAAAIIGTTALIIANWETVQNWLSSFWSWLSSSASSAWDSVKRVFSNVGGFFANVFSGIVNTFRNIGTTIGDTIGGAFKTVINTIVGGAARIINGFIDSINFAVDAINGIPGVNVGKLGRINVPMLAEGGIVSSPTLAMIGEGTESEAVIPLSKLDKMLEGGGSSRGQSIVINMDGIMARSRSDLREVAKDLLRAIDEEREAKGLQPINGAIA